ncbi:OmpA family protein [Spirosoma sp.]|uniref:OmpA family protein n=1 Tax=Spirosoma sp. TaxID=1899569 RepID=UPI002637CB5D|nr:OmpA family protein [Spirosoma sp.]MCX6214601.1 OmpA family protein [Spirosoma sp.]
MPKLCLLLVFSYLLQGTENEVRAQVIRLQGEVQDHRWHQPLPGSYQWVDSARQTIAEQAFSAAGFTGIVPKGARSLVLKSTGYRTITVPVHWAGRVSDSLSFRVVIPLVPIDKPSASQPYFQSEQRPLRLTADTLHQARAPVQFLVSDALTNRPVLATLCLFSTKLSGPACYTTSNQHLKLIASDIVAIEVNAKAYQPYLGNVVVADSDTPVVLTIRLNPTPTVLMVRLPGASNLRLTATKGGHVYPLTPIDKTHFLGAAPPGNYQLTGMKPNGDLLREPVHVAEGITGYVPLEADQPQTVSRRVIYFPQSSYELTDSAKVTLNRIARELHRRPEQSILLVGYTDAIGDLRLNLTLSEFRARSTRAYLRQQGVSEERLRLEAKGAKCPAAPNDTEENRRFNRRVCLFFH